VPATTLITGAEGFVGMHLCALLGPEARSAGVDVLDPEALARAVREASPRAVVHLAALASVASSWHGAREVWEVNLLGTVSVLEAVKAEAPQARVLVVSTGEVYGRAAEIPTPETAPIAPLSPYAASKAAAEIACERAARADGLDVVVARSFTHAGPGQSEQFAIGSWVRQLARLEEAGGGRLAVGDLSPERDVTDVRDVCCAYRLLLDPAMPRGVYNVASGRALKMERIVELLVETARVPVTVEQEPSRVRPVEVPVVAGDASKLTEATGWAPRIPIEQTLSDALDYARAALAGERVESV
jgi:GDP-4-dehydro-6-deoxy-D-mannose reductase